MMSADLKKMVKESLERSRKWAEDGWKVTFGPRQLEISSLQHALDLPLEAPNREEAIGYWKNVEGISEEVSLYLEAALADLEKGDLKAAENKLYFAQYYEKPLEQYTKTSKPVYESILKR